MNNKRSETGKGSTLLITLFTMLILSSCSDSNSEESNTIVADTNNILVAKAGVDFTVYETEGINLDASGSYSGNRDTLSYNWTQIEGEEVSIEDNSLEKLSFFTPDIDNNTTLKFKLEVSDNAGNSNSDEIEIKILKETKVSQRQEVMAETNTINDIDQIVSIPFTYTIFPTITTTGLSVKMYWDNSKLEFTDIKDAFQEDYIGYSAIQADLDNEDNDKSTNSYVIITWLNKIDGKWLTPNLPLALMTPTFNVLDKTNGATYVNLRSAFESPNVLFYSHATLIKL